MQKRAKIGDGKIFVFDVEQVVRIPHGETGFEERYISAFEQCTCKGSWNTAYSNVNCRF